MNLQEFDQRTWEKKIVKLYKMLAVMEKLKYLEPHFSTSLRELVLQLSNSAVSGSSLLQIAISI